ncbi:MAG: crossover junction endodeoxyribonuclease RuvC [Bacteroidales bacterium]|nr:crossover junction endodeoxyribonuclease RuvC [Bacteroidales bacterium]
MDVSPTLRSRRILGLDPGLQTTGYGVLECTVKGIRVAEAGVIRSAHDGRDTPDMADRVKVLYDGLVEILDQWKPTAIAVEQLFAHYEHPRTAILMAHARGCFFLAGAQRGIPVFSYAPTRVKKTITGHGRASKEQMQAAITRELNLAKPPEPHDVADALGIALCHGFASGFMVHGPRSSVFTGVNLKALLGESVPPTVQEPLDNND